MIRAGLSLGEARRGVIIGELLVGALLLLVAVSSVAALMYNVSKRDDAAPKVECIAGTKSTDAKCVAPKLAARAAKVVKAATNSVCSGKSAALTEECGATSAASSDGVVLKQRTDSAAMAIVAKREKARRRTVRTDLGFVH